MTITAKSAISNEYSKLWYYAELPNKVASIYNGQLAMK